MLPTIPPGARVALRVAPRAADLAIRPGDIVCYRRGRALITHRALCRRGGGWLLAGDNALAGAEVVATEAIWGVVQAYDDGRVGVSLAGMRWRALRVAQLAYVCALGAPLAPLLARSARARLLYGLALRASVWALRARP